MEWHHENNDSLVFQGNCWLHAENEENLNKTEKTTINPLTSATYAMGRSTFTALHDDDDDDNDDDNDNDDYYL